MTTGPRLKIPRGSAAISFVSTLMIVVGIGLAWTGLLLAAAGLILSWIDTKELLRLNPQLVQSAEAGGAVQLPAGLRRISRTVTASTAVGALVALGAVQVTGDPWSAVPPGIIAAVTALVLHRQLERAAG